ncbi:hypothetical protein [Nonomuraea maritima]|uniref:hypothetical protein n=1 Tax=Nonomuraea maritima TaxID=683260 RepID=UPI003724865F
MTVPACEDCNKWLNDNFERPAHAAITKTLDECDVPLTYAETTALARWLGKTSLLLQHQEAKGIVPGDEDRRQRDCWEVATRLVRELRRGSELPDDLSIWMARADDTDGNAELSTSPRIYLPTTSGTGGLGGESVATSFGIGMRSGAMLCVQVAYHPLVDIAHPFEGSRFAIRLWPDPPAKFNIRNLPRLSTVGRRQFNSVFVRGAGHITLPLPDERVTCRPDVDPLMDFWTHWGRSMPVDEQSPETGSDHE